MSAHVLRTDPNRPEDHHVTCSVEDGKVTLSGDVRYACDDRPVGAMVPVPAVRNLENLPLEGALVTSGPVRGAFVDRCSFLTRCSSKSSGSPP